MSRGKYSPWCYHNKQSDTSYEFNCYGEVPVVWNKENYDEKLMFDNYDSEGFDSYGYSAFKEDGTYAGVGSGIDRYGYTENDYLSMSDDKFDDVCAYAKVLTEFKRNRDEQSIVTKPKRKTKAEKQAEADIEIKTARVREWEEFKAEYPTRFAALLFDFHKFSATDYNLDVVRTEDNYEFCWGTSWNRKSVDLKPVPPSQQSWEYLYGLEAAEAAIQEEHDRIAEAERKQRLRQAALDKLTDEEKQALGFA